MAKPCLLIPQSRQHHLLLPVQANMMYKTAEEEEDMEETAPPSPHSKFDKMFKTAKDAVNATQPPPHATFDIKGMMKYSKHFDPSVARQVLGEFFLIHPIMTDCLLKLRVIYVDNPDKEHPIQILLIISMLEFIVANARGKTGGTSLQEYITFIRGQWGLVGGYINLGTVPDGKLVLHLLAFCTKECIKYIGTDPLDKMMKNNHTILIFRDHLLAAGFDCDKEECQRIVTEHIAKSDGWIESGLVGEAGNDWDKYVEQLDVRFAPFCEEYEEELVIADGPSIIQEEKFYNFRGVHIIGAAGLLNVLLRALLAREKNGNALSVLIESQRVRDLFFVCKDNTHQLDVFRTNMIRIHPFTHPNHHQCFLTSAFSEAEIRKLDHSYSEAHRPLDGVQINVKGAQNNVYNAASSDGNLQRYRLRLEAKKAGIIDPKEADKLRTLEELERVKRRSQTFFNSHKKLKQR
eukprot:scaffold8139_cov132-Skeletonema_dohrnii-CCMP3373.AAC.3